MTLVNEDEFLEVEKHVTEIRPEPFVIVTVGPFHLKLPGLAVKESQHPRQLLV